MTRLLIHVEGQTEEEFVACMIRPHLLAIGFTEVSARLMGPARKRSNRGGVCGWPTAKAEINRHLSHDKAAFATTFVDFYALPDQGYGCWPDRDNCAGLSLNAQSGKLQAAIALDVQNDCGYQIANRFVPYVAMHEFEGLLFSDPAAMAEGMGCPNLSDDFQMIRDAFTTPEHINDSKETAPSKRIIGLLPGYQKVLQGNLAALEVSLPSIRVQCPIFDAWLSKLEALLGN